MTRLSPNSGPAAGRPGILRWLAAMTYDLLLVIALLMVLTSLIMMARFGASFDPQSIWFRIALLVGWWAYFAWSWTHGGQTVGMRAWRIRLSRRDGQPAGLGTATMRFAAAWLSALAVGLGFIWRIFDPDKMTWHDRLSGTVLEFRPKLAKPDDSESSDK